MCSSILAKLESQPSSKNYRLHNYPIRLCNFNLKMHFIVKVEFSYNLKYSKLVPKNSGIYQHQRTSTIALKTIKTLTLLCLIVGGGVSNKMQQVGNCQDLLKYGRCF